MKTFVVSFAILMGLASCSSPSLDDKTTMKVEALYGNGKKVEGTNFDFWVVEKNGIYDTTSDGG